MRMLSQAECSPLPGESAGIVYTDPGNHQQQAVEELVHDGCGDTCYTPASAASEDPAESPASSRRCGRCLPPASAAGTVCFRRCRPVRRRWQGRCWCAAPAGGIFGCAAGSAYGIRCRSSWNHPPHHLTGSHIPSCHSYSAAVTVPSVS